MKRIALLLVGFAVSHIATAQISITSSSLTYTQNFDGLDTASTASSNLPTGWLIKENGTSATVDQMYKGSNGAGNAGDVYSYGTTGSTERALGSLASGTNRPNYGVRFTNNTGSTITSITVSYRAEEWRSGPSTAGDTTRFYYNLTATGVDTFVTGDVEVASLRMTSVVPALPAGAVDGNAAGNHSALTGTITVNIPNGSSILFKWVDWQAFGSDEGFAVDDFSATFNAGPPVPNPILVSKTPTNGATGVTPGLNLIMGFDKNVTGMAAGSIRIKNVTAQTTVTKAGNSLDVSIAGMTVTISNAGDLASNSSYYVTFDSTAFQANSVNSFGLYDTTGANAWAFTTGNLGITNAVKHTLGLSVLGTPSGNNVNITYTLPEAGTYTLHVIDMSGRILRTESFNAASGTQTRSISGLTLASGTYIIRVENETSAGVARAMVQ